MYRLPKASVKIIEAIKGKIVLESRFGKDGRISIPAANRELISNNALVVITILEK